MASFDDERAQLHRARAETAAGSRRLRQAIEARRRLESEIERLRRGANDRSGAAVRQRIADVDRRLVGVATDVERLGAELEAARGRESALEERFESFTDPTSAIRNVPDSHPFLLFPVRIETRFATLDDGSRQLWVRVFPDDMLVDTFDPEVAEAERTNTRLHWINVWRAGGDDEERRAAWRSLARSHGSGRARWLLDQMAPLNPEEEPVRAVDDHILVIAPDEPVPDAEKADIATYWAAVWQATATDVAGARAALDGALGTSRAGQVVDTLVPENFHDVAVKRTVETNVVVAYLDLPSPGALSTRQLTWSQAAKVWLLPERFVLLGFTGRDQTLAALGRRIPAELQIGPDPSQDPSDALAPDGEDLAVPETLAWTVDFDEAVRVGMGFRVDLADDQSANGFDRLFVLGVRLASGAADGAADLETLVAHHQASRKGLSLLPQGRPTNNTDQATSGYTWWEDPDEAYDHFFVQDPTDDPADWRRRTDGRWLAGLLGIDREVLKRSPHYFGTDLAEARAMNIALWPATLGYFLEHMMSPLVAEDTIERTRAFFNRFVVGSGLAPAIRIGRQPYGVLPTTAFSRMRWTAQPPKAGDAPSLRMGHLAELHALIEAAAGLWRELGDQVPYVGMATDDPQQSLLDIVGLHPASVEFHQRYAETFDELYNRLSYSPFAFHVDAYEVAQEYVQSGLQVLADLGLGLPVEGQYPAILDKFFLLGANLLKGDLVEPEPLSETAPLAIRRADGRNYLQWLAQAARTSHDALRRQEGFGDERPPSELLYLTVRHALDLGFVDTSIDLLEGSDVIGPGELAAVRTEPRFIHVDEPNADTGSRWQLLYRAEESITGDPNLLIGEFIPGILGELDAYLDEQLSAVDRLAETPTAALERAFVAHLDCCSYRLDAWRHGLIGAQVALMRGDDGTDDDTERNGGHGVLIGAYGWLEDVRPKPATRAPVELDPELTAVFDRPGDPPLMRDATNLGHIHAPSLDQAVAAAILRNGYLANATPDNPEALAVNLSSERVRTAMKIVEGIRNGQSLGALLGYQLERSLHDSDDLFLDRLIFELRRLFPLAGNRITSTATDDTDVPITAIEARNVVDGLALVEHFDTPGVATAYPFDLTGLPSLADLAAATPLSPTELGAVIDAKVDRVRDLNDAVADLATAEGVYQVVKGNYDRASGTLEAFNKGHYPPTPDVAATPRSGHALTNRIGLHLEAGLDPADPVNTTPRSKGEPALNAWLDGFLPPMASIFAAVEHSDPVTGTEGSQTVSMADLDLLPIDLFFVVGGGAGERGTPGLDELLVHHARRASPHLRYDTSFRPVYRPDVSAGFTVFEVAPLVRALRGLILGSRPLRATDLMLPNEASAAADTQSGVRDDKAAGVLADLTAKSTLLRTLAVTLETAVGEAVDEAVAEPAAVVGIDEWTGDYSDAVHDLRLFGLPPVDLTLAADRARPHVASLAAKVGSLEHRWEDKLQRFDAVVADYTGLPLGTTDEQRFALLIRAGRIVSTTVVAPLPPTPDDMLAHVLALRGDLAAALDDLRIVLDGATRLGQMYAAVEAFAPRVTAFDLDPLDLTPYPPAMLSIARDLQRATATAVADIDARLAAAQAQLDELPATEPARQTDLVVAAAHALLGDSFVLLPEFALSADQLAEWENAWDDREAILAHLQTGPDGTPFPVDDWLHGLARVRRKAGHAETVALLGGALEVAQDLAFTPLQFPYRAKDVWLGGPFPDTWPGTTDPFRIEADHLLYTPHIGPGAEVDPADPGATYCGILLDEWVEVIPDDEETTGLSFHFDRPGSEPPQALLLVTPPAFTGSWSWDDLVATLHDTLDHARLRAVEPGQIDTSPLARYLPALLSSVTVYPITAALNYGFNNDLPRLLAEADFE